MKRFVSFKLILHVLLGIGTAVLLLLPGLVAADWFSQNSGTTGDLWSIHFPVDDQTGYAAGGFGGLILKTTNGGVTWVIQPSKTIWCLFSVHFPDALNGYVVGDYGIYVKTTNGGATWDSLWTGTLNRLVSVQFPVDAETGYAVGNAGTILKTTNGGTIWVIQNSGTDCGLCGVNFPVDAQTGYAVGWDVNPPRDVILNTTDGGATWVSQPHPTILPQAVDFPVDASTGYVVSDWGDILKTTDGGRTWVTQNSGTTGQLWGVDFVDNLTGYAVGGEFVGTKPRGIILRTTDGGATWNSQTNPATEYLTSVSFPVDANTGYAVGMTGIILKTVDGGVWVEEEKGQEDRRIREQSYTAFPNPFISFATVLGHDGEIFALYDISGRQVATFQGKRIGEGLPSGVYFLKPVAGNRKPVRVVKVR